LPKPGEGPSRELCERGYFKARIYGTAEGEPRPSAVCRVEGDGDPGYGATSRMLAEAALYLADTATEGRPGGVLTPASALGLPFAERLGAAGVRFRVEEYRAEARRAEAEVRP
jgi:short subunit dehydrogenase-like uncharacterized protein